jgi:hypothetical protein
MICGDLSVVAVRARARDSWELGSRHRSKYELADLLRASKLAPPLFHIKPELPPPKARTPSLQILLLTQLGLRRHAQRLQYLHFTIPGRSLPRHQLDSYPIAHDTTMKLLKHRLLPSLIGILLLTLLVSLPTTVEAKRVSRPIKLSPEDLKRASATSPAKRSGRSFFGLSPPGATPRQLSARDNENEACRVTSKPTSTSACTLRTTLTSTVSQCPQGQRQVRLCPREL